MSHPSAPSFEGCKYYIIERGALNSALQGHRAMQFSVCSLQMKGCKIDLGEETLKLLDFKLLWFKHGFYLPCSKETIFVRNVKLIN